MKQWLWTRLSASPWLVPLLGLWLISAVDDELVDLVGFDNAAGIIMVLGGIFGAAWYTSCLADRWRSGSTRSRCWQ
jgi:hypothetical protein